MGLAILLETGKSSQYEFGQALKPLGIFGLVHGVHEWYEMFIIIYPDLLVLWSPWITVTRIVLLAVSFFMLVVFGSRLIIGPERLKPRLIMMSIVVMLWLFGLIWVNFQETTLPERALSSDVYTRYALAIPGAALTAWGLMIQRQKFGQRSLQTYGRDLAFAAAAFLLYGIIGQLFAAPSELFPSTILNINSFMRWFGFPVQVFRGAMAVLIAIFMIRSLRSFEVENQQQIEELRESQLAERRRLSEIRAELLRHTVRAQESERQRIARELHDQTGQHLTALGMGLRALEDNIATNPQKAIQQAHQLEKFATDGIQDLQHVITGLRPPQLDELGLLAALRWMANDFSQQYQLPIEVTSQGNGIELPDDARIVFFRIAQEALLNVVRHANASSARIHLENLGPKIILSIEDDGDGFNSEIALHTDQKYPSWGLLGMVERSVLVGADLEIDSYPGKGTKITVSLERE